MDNNTTAIVGRICQLITAHDGKMTLAQLSEKVHISPSHLQRLFKQVTGISPREYAEQHRHERLKASLQNGEEVTRALYEAGYGSSSRLYEKAQETFGMTPATYKNKGKNMMITYLIRASLLEFVLMARTAKGICAVYFAETPEALEAMLVGEYAHAQRHRADDDPNLLAWYQALEQHLEGDFAHENVLELPLDVQGTLFQTKVWQLLRKIPLGETRSYQQIAEMLGQPTATRAVARAIASNQVSVLIPCHRVVRSDGHMSGYRWGVERKQRLLMQEKSVNK